MAVEEFCSSKELSNTMFSSLFGFVAVAGVCLAIPTQRALNDTSSPVVTVKNGSYSGTYNPTYNQDIFLGIPYAKVSESKFHENLD